MGNDLFLFIFEISSFLNNPNQPSGIGALTHRLIYTCYIILTNMYVGKNYSDSDPYPNRIKNTIARQKENRKSGVSLNIGYKTHIS